MPTTFIRTQRQERPPQRRVIIERQLPPKRTIIERYREPVVQQEPARPRRHTYVLPAQAPPPPPPPMPRPHLIVPPHEPPRQQQVRCCPCPEPKQPPRMPTARIKPRRRREARSKLNLDIIADPKKLMCLEDQDLLNYALTALAALNTCDEDDEDDEDGDEVVGDAVEVVCPPDAKPGDVISVHIPAELGGGTISASVPVGATPGMAFDVHPPHLADQRMRRRRRR